MSASTSEHYRLAYSLAVEQLQIQAQDLRATRNSASIAIAFSGLIATSGSALISQDFAKILSYGQPILFGVHIWFWVLLILLGTSTALAILALTSTRVCNFNLNPKFIIEKAGNDGDQLMIQLAMDANDYFDKNEVTIIEAQNFVRWALITAWVQIIPWTIVIGSLQNV